ncbi:hypothetical protein [Emticicia soli]|uniref:Uncharacterized protein n=1 Tax=Emticicia soli TaxID=2027878 RepID=A0ABW5J6V6_9BACT
MSDDMARPYINPQSEAYGRVVKQVKNLYEHKITEKEAHEAARNLINFFQILLEMKQQMK